MAEILIYLVPRKYRSIGHFLVGFGPVFIILSFIFSYDYINILGHCCLIMGLSGIYFSKTKNFKVVSKSTEKEGIEQESLNGISGKLVYIFSVITIVGIISVLILIFQVGFAVYFNYILMFVLTGYIFLISGFLILYFKKRKASWYRLENLPMKYRLSKRLKCKDCGNKFKSKIMQCPECNGKDIKIRWDSR